mmetsp:Transcript_25608/g.52143  ORF Transcript_25608/g.52143 Transcript_25608/m.52143 type:complete len:80 (-) Transcript_25608:100-339(-)
MLRKISHGLFRICTLKEMHSSWREGVYSYFSKSLQWQRRENLYASTGVTDLRGKRRQTLVFLCIDVPIKSSKSSPWLSR